jgi:3-hydroxybutyryl-CoA dehydrogenase
VSETICVVGAGQMGSGIAQVAAVAGYDVTLVDVEPRQLERARAGIEATPRARSAGSRRPASRDRPTSPSRRRPRTST